ncbi:MAG: C39 family peptidase [Weeksellaceae bacterium]
MTTRNTIVVLALVAILAALSSYLYFRGGSDTTLTFPRNEVGIPPVASPTASVQLAVPPAQYIIPMRTHVFQSFNNCGPATLSMQLSYNNINETQQTLGQKLRPYQNPQGDNDDKSVTLAELADEAINYNLIAFHRPGGSIELMKQFISNDIPVVVRTWLHPDEDIGHYRLVRGYDETTRELIQDDSYENKDLRYSYETFMQMWQPFNYEYLVMVPADKQAIAEAIIADAVDVPTAWQRALADAQTESQAKPDNPYLIFNQSIAQFHLGNYAEAVRLYESVATRLPARTLWYQIEPIEAYLELGNYERVFAISDQILNNSNRGYSELYVLRGKAYEKQNNIEAARAEYEKAVFYNINNQEAKDALARVQ